MNRTILNAGMILCGEQLTPMENGSLIIEDGIIGEILPQEAREALSIEDAEEISLPHMTLMPGMIECHNHLCIDATLPEHLELLAWSNECQLTLLALKGLKEDLMSGVTTARCMGDKYYIDVTLKKLIILSPAMTMLSVPLSLLFLQSETLSLKASRASRWRKLRTKRLL